MIFEVSFPRPAASALPENLLIMQIIGPHPRPAKSKPLDRGEPGNEF